MNRREFLINSSVVTAATLASQSTLANVVANHSPLKILVLGGRDYFGPTLVDTLLAQGHQVSLFNRGFTNPELFPQLTWIKGNREINDGSGLALLKQHLKHHNYDIAIDTWQKAPLAVLEMAKLLKKHIGQYQYISSIAVYKDNSTIGINEEFPLRDLSESTIEHKRLRYGERKAWAETALFEELGEKAITFRSHGMRSNRLPDRIYEPYWPARFLDGGQILLPKDDNHIMQVCDVKSMTQFMTLAAEKQLHGAYNIALPTTDFTDYLAAVDKVTQRPHEKIWIPKSFLADQGIEPYRDLPLWRPQLPGFYQIQTDKAIKAGFNGRSISAMVTDQLSGYLKRNPNKDFLFGVRGTISRQKERQVLEAWFNQANS